MKCPICDLEVPQMEPNAAHLIVTTSNEHVHVHGNLDKKMEMKNMIDAAIEHTDLAGDFKSSSKNDFPFKEVLFHNRQRIGDMLVFTAGVRDFHKAFPDVKINVISTAAHIWDNNPNIDRTLQPFYKNGKTLETITPADFFAGDTNVVKIGPGKLTNMSNRTDLHFTNAYRISIEDNLKVKFDQGLIKPDIWLTKEEYDAPSVTDKPYWIIVIGGEKGWGCKMYPFEKWQEFVNQNPDTLFYQLGSQGDNHPKLQGKNIIDYIGKTEDRNTGIRDLYKLFLNAEGSIGLVSFHMHLSGALEKPCIVVAGAREPVSFTRYVGHQYLATDGCLPCALKACWHCDIKACKHLIGNNIPQCVDIISPNDLTTALNKYYQGGRLKKGVQSAKPKFSNIVKNTIVQTLALKVPAEPTNTKDYGLPFNAGSVTIRDWEFIKDTIKENNIKTVLEFGAGLSTLLLQELGVKVISYETMAGWIEKVKKINPLCDVRLWDGQKIELTDKFDLAFVDGPSGGGQREIATKIASELATTIIIHDAARKEEMQWQAKYLKGKFIGPGGGGHRCHLWSKIKDIKISLRTGSPLMDIALLKEIVKPPEPIITTVVDDVACRVVNDNSKFIKFVSTARGWGGCARSITTIMKHLLKAGHKVEFIPFRNSVGSREFQECIKNELQNLIVTTNYDTISEACDVLMMYADDYVWEFNKPEIGDIFSNINAQKKIMMLNYRRGPVGQAEWTKGWDKYMFLNSTQEKELLKLIPNAKTKVLPPCTELDDFFAVNPDFNKNITLVRHSSQGDTKFDKHIAEEISSILNCRENVDIVMLPGPSFIIPYESSFVGHGFWKEPRTADPKVIAEFLSKGNLFWYSLPKGYMDMGPRVIIEAMAVGLPILADNWGGAVDRVTPECGWLCSKEQMVEIVKNVTLEELKKKGQAARERARTFKPENWIKEIIND